ncbi:ABC transporter permease [Prescottella defluvii]|uniref:ABC transporter permease n=1 Tax=Prescottella defluvii TaxID=1323361 RepID=UPI0004F2D682|nr:ABC transporter permease [Prescottella defluvii]
MLRFAARRLLMAIPLLLVVSFVVFVLIDLAPGDPAVTLAGENPTPAQVEQIREQLRLDDSLPERYAVWLAHAVQGDLGQSFVNGQSVAEMVGDRLTVTLSLVLVAMILTLVIGPLAGLAAAARPGAVVDRMITALASAAIAVPPFWLGLILVVVLAVNLGWLPALGYEPLAEGFGPWISHLILPAIALAMLPMAEVALQLKTSLADVLGRDYILNAEAKGLSVTQVRIKHAAKNAAVPVVTVLGSRFAQMIGGTVAIETVFGLAGLGTLAVNSVLGRDIPVLLGLVVLTTAIVLVVNLLVDISYGYFNPKVRA